MGRPQCQTKDEESNSPPPSYESRAESLWIFEILALILSFGSLVALFAVLTRFNNQPLTEWRLPHFSINALVTLCSTVSKAALILPLASGLGQYKWLLYRTQKPRPLIDFQRVDAASRGSWGASQLVLRSWKSPIVMLGALAMALAFLMELFLQQSLAFPNRLVVVGRAYVANTDFWDGGFDHAIQVAAYNSLSTVQEARYSTAVHPTCSTGNCTFDVFDTLGVCAECVDISDTLSYSTTNLTNLCAQYPDKRTCERVVSPNGLTLDFTLDARLRCFPGEPCTTYDDSTSSGAEPGFSVFNLTAGPLNTNRLHTDNVSWLANISVIGRPRADLTLGYDCAMYQCVKRYTASVRDGVYSERVLATYKNMERIDTTAFPFNDPFDSASIATLLNLTIANLSAEDSASNQTAVFTSTWKSTLALRSYFVSVFGDDIANGVVSAQELANGSYVGTYLPSNAPVVASLWARGIDPGRKLTKSTKEKTSKDENNTTTTSTSNDKDNNDDNEVKGGLPSTLSELAEALTNVVRRSNNHINEINPIISDKNVVNNNTKKNDTNTNTNNKAVSNTNTNPTKIREKSSQGTGQALGPVTFIQVRWGWLILPLTLEFMAVAFLVGTIARTARSDVPSSWRNSALVLFYHGPTSSSTFEFESAMGRGAMTKEQSRRKPRQIEVGEGKWENGFANELPTNSNPNVGVDGDINTSSERDDALPCQLTDTTMNMEMDTSRSLEDAARRDLVQLQLRGGLDSGSESTLEHVKGRAGHLRLMRVPPAWPLPVPSTWEVLPTVSTMAMSKSKSKSKSNSNSNPNSKSGMGTRSIEESRSRSNPDPTTTAEISSSRRTWWLR